MAAKREAFKLEVTVNFYTILELDRGIGNINYTGEKRIKLVFVKLRHCLLFVLYTNNKQCRNLTKTNLMLSSPTSHWNESD